MWKPLAPLTSITGAVGGNALKYLSAVISALSTGNGPFRPRQGCTIRSIAVTRRMQAATFVSPACTLLFHTLFERYLQFLKLPTDLLPGIDRVWILTGLDENTTTGSTSQNLVYRYYSTNASNAPTMYYYVITKVYLIWWQITSTYKKIGPTACSTSIETWTSSGDVVSNINRKVFFVQLKETIPRKYSFWNIR